MTQQQALRVMSDHSIDATLGADSAHIDCLAISVWPDGQVCEQWVSINTTKQAILAWLGY